MSTDVLVVQDGKSRIGVLRLSGRKGLVLAEADSLKEAFRALNLDYSALSLEGPCLGMGYFDEDGRPLHVPPGERLHRNVSEDPVGCWVYLVALKKFLIITDSVVCYRFEGQDCGLAVILPLDQPRMCLGATPDWLHQTMYKGGILPKPYGREILDPDTDVNAMAARFGLSYPLQ